MARRARRWCSLSAAVSLMLATALASCSIEQSDGGYQAVRRAHVKVVAGLVRHRARVLAVRGREGQRRSGWAGGADPGARWAVGG